MNTNPQTEKINELTTIGWRRTFTKAQMKLPPAYRITGGSIYLTRNKTEAMFVNLDGTITKSELIEPID